MGAATKGGTVVPPCDFHCDSTANPLYIGVSAFSLSGARAPAPAPTRGTNQLSVFNHKKNVNIMSNEKLVPCSTRLDPEVLEKIEEFRKNRRYWKRNTVINAILTAVVNDFDDRAIYDMVCRPHHGYNHVTADYKRGV